MGKIKVLHHFPGYYHIEFPPAKFRPVTIQVHYHGLYPKLSFGHAERHWIYINPQHLISFYETAGEAPIPATYIKNRMSCSHIRLHDTASFVQEERKAPLSVEQVVFRVHIPERLIGHTSCFESSPKTNILVLKKDV